jgi:type IV pilus assembly protein PilY1
MLGDNMKRMLALCTLAIFSLSNFAEDIELYVGNSTQRSGVNPKVLIIFDNSGSMASIETVSTPYDPDVTYPAVGGFNSLSDKFVYYTKGTGFDNTAPIPDSPSEQRRFLADINSCATAREKLETYGFYTGHIREYAFSGNSGSWQEIPDNNGANMEVIDCEDDVNQIPANPDVNYGKDPKSGAQLPNGYPINGKGTKKKPVYYGTLSESQASVTWAGEVVTLYTDNYLRWNQSNTTGTVDMSRMAVAKRTVTDLIGSTPSVDFGLQIFNANAYNENERDGGRVVFGIQSMTSAAQAKLNNIINNEISPETNTPLCETLFEASRYFGGKSVKYGDDDSDIFKFYTANTPPRDMSIEANGSYISPFSACTNEVYVILITDGTPTLDQGADVDIKALSGIGAPFSINGEDNYLPALAGWMHTHDLNDNKDDGDQTATIFTIGFSEGAEDAAPLLDETAKQGGGKYYPAKDPSTLLSSLQASLIEILRVNASFTAPSIASNNFDRTETLDSVYYAMFLPDRGPRWQGNLKKLKVENGIQVDRDGVSAIDNAGNIAASAKTYWGTSATGDGNEVAKGGVAEMLRNKSDRKIYSNIGTTGSLVDLTRKNAESYFGSASALATELNVLEDEIDDYLDWAKGIDVDDADQDGSKKDMRSDVFADPLHSKPLVINYGGSKASQDVRIIVGTNAGVLHMFDDNGDTIDESWAFMPHEFFKKYKTLRDNFTTSTKVYGIDGSASAYVFDKNGDGTVDSGAGDKAWLFVGLRRGGSSYYALDITIPDTPTLMWHIDSSSSGFGELGQSWSRPKVGYSAINTANSTAKPVLFIGGGYATSKDASGPGTSDNAGRAVYMLDAESGSLLWSLSPASASSKNTQLAGITDSVPSSIATMDSDSDGFIDRLYFGDTGGNVWRTDMPSSDPKSSTEPWTAFKLAELGGTSDETDRRFFSEPSVVRTLITNTIKSTTTDEEGNTNTVVTKQEVPYDAVLIGSGDRSTPSDTVTDDKFFMLKDKHIITKSFLSDAVPAPIEVDALYDYTNNPFGQSLSTTARESLEIAVSLTSGWFVDFSSSGEKSLSSATAIAGVAYFNSFTPAEASSGNTCQLNAGGGSLYAIDLALGTNVYQWRQLSVGDRVPDTPTVIIPPAISGPSKLLFVGVGKGTGGGTITLCEANDCDPDDPNTGISLETLRTYLYVTENP